MYRRLSAIVAIAIHRSKAQRVKHMPRHNEAKKSGCDDCKDHERDDLLHDASPYTPKSFGSFLSRPEPGAGSANLRGKP
jgi:hypothetical protein